jgi:hypothetical protein
LAALIAPPARIAEGTVAWAPFTRLVVTMVGLAAMKAIRPGLLAGT